MEWSPNSQEIVEGILDALPVLAAYWDSNLRNRMASKAYVDFFGKSVQEARGIHIREMLGSALYEEDLAFIEGALRGERQVFAREIAAPPGEIRWIQASYIPDIADDGKVRGFFALITDITRQRQIEGEIEQNRTRLAEAERLARLGSWDWDIPNRKMTCSGGLFEIYGIKPEEFDETFDVGTSQYVHPGDRALVEAEMRQALERGTPVDFEFRIIRPDGRVRRLHSRAELIADADGNPLRLTGTAQDVTEVRAAAEVLHQTATDLGRRAAELHHLPHRASRSTEDLSRLLTPRQVEILGLVAEGLSNSEIASRLFLGESTVKWHIRKILRALGVANRAQAVARYLSVQQPR
jgi:PAS domain S-box-containing protein